MVFVACKGYKREKGTLAFRRVINVIFDVADLQSSRRCQGYRGCCCDAAGLWDAAEAAGGTGSVKRSYWVLVCVMDANRTKPW